MSKRVSLVIISTITATVLGVVGNILANYLERRYGLIDNVERTIIIVTIFISAFLLSIWLAAKLEGAFSLNDKDRKTIKYRNSVGIGSISAGRDAIVISQSEVNISTNVANISTNYVSPVSRTLHNLPQLQDKMIGRERELEELVDALEKYPITTIQGVAGVGKTVLAIVGATQYLKASERRCVIWISAKEGGISLTEVIDQSARVLGYLYLLSLSLNEKREDIKEILAINQTLLVVDNFESVQDKRVASFLLALPAPTKVLITSREYLILDSKVLNLTGVTWKSAKEILIATARKLKLIGSIRLTPHAIQHAYRLAKGNPLGLKLLIGQMRQSGESLSQVLDHVEAKGEGYLIENLFSGVWELASPQERSILTIMPVFRAPATSSAIAAAIGVSQPALGSSIQNLVNALVIEGVGIGKQRRYSAHPLVLGFAREQLASVAEIEETAFQHLANYFSEFAREHGGDEWGWRGLDEIEPESANIFTTLNRCFSTKKHSLAVELTKAITFFCGLRNYWSEILIYSRQAIEAADLSGDLESAAWLRLNALGWYLDRQGNSGEAVEVFNKALRLYEEIDDPIGQANALRNIGDVMRRQGHFEEARHVYSRASPLVPSNGYLKLALTPGLRLEFAKLFRDQGQLQEAFSLYQELANWLKDRELLLFANCLIRMGGIALQLKRIKTAHHYCDRSKRLFEMMNVPDGLASADLGLAYAELALGNLDLALGYATSALTILTKVQRGERLDSTRKLLLDIQKQIDEQGK